MTTLAYVVNANLPPDDWAHSIQIINMCRAWSEVGVQVTLYVPKRNMLVYEPFTYYGIPKTFTIERVWCLDLAVRSPKAIFYWIRFLSFYITVRLKLFWKHFDIIYSRDIYAAFFFPGVALERHSFPKHISRVHRIAFRLSSALVVLTSFIQERMIQAGVKKEKICVAPDGVDIKAFHTTANGAPLHFDFISQNDFVFGYIGTLKTMNMEKGLSDCLKSLQSLPKHFKLLVVGGEPADIEYYKTMAEGMSVSSQVLFTGKVPHRDVPRYAELCHVLVAPFPANEHYSFFMSPLKIFEYMASKRPIISTELPSIQEVLTHDVNAILIPPGNPAALAHALERLYNEPQYGERLATEAYRDVVEKYTWIKRAEHILLHIYHGNRTSR